MVGGLLQLKEKGAQDLYLTGQPQITFFKTVYRRYTNFSIESIEQLFDNLQSYLNLQFLDISGNIIPTSASKSLCNFLDKTKSLETLIMKGCF